MSKQGIRVAIAAAMTVAFTAAAQDAPGKPVKLSGLKGFANPQKVLKALVADKQGPQSNHFCVVGYKPVGPDSAIAWVHWRETKSLILWEPAAPGQATVLSQSRRYLNLVTDVVAAEDQLKGSSYKVTKAWTDRLLGDCARAGQRYFIKK